jgi:hypothetical protein
MTARFLYSYAPALAPTLVDNLWVGTTKRLVVVS